ncbi:MAG: RNA polymerase sigma factor [Bacteroidota bacterium]
MKNLQDDQLVRDLQKGSIQAFDAIYHRYHTKVYHFALNLQLTVEDAEEVVQEVFCAIWNTRQKIDPSLKFSSYLFGIARNQAHTILRKKTQMCHYLKILEVDPIEKESLTERYVISKEMNELLSQYIELMPARRKEIFYLSRFEGLTYLQIASRLSITENTVDTQIRKALSFLRKIFQ